MDTMKRHQYKSFHRETLKLILKANEFISQYKIPLTVRQIYYRFVGEQLIENSLKSYKKIATILAEAREQEFIEYASIVDRTRQVIKPSSWSNPSDFFQTVRKAYKKTLLVDQDNYIEVWVEKDALVGVFEPITEKYDINLVSGRGYPSHSALYQASVRANTDKTIKYLYFGDFDPSGEDIFRDIRERMANLFGIQAEFEKVALTEEDIKKYNLPPAPTKITDSRTTQFVAKHGDVSVELDALPPDVLTEKIEEAIMKNLDMTKYQNQLQLQLQDKEQIDQLINEIGGENT